MTPLKRLLARTFGSHRGGGSTRLERYRHVVGMSVGLIKAKWSGELSGMYSVASKLATLSTYCGQFLSTCYVKPSLENLWHMPRCSWVATIDILWRKSGI